MTEGFATTKEDRMTITILPDGTIKTIVDGISGANHASADAFVGEVDRLAGGDVVVNKRGDQVHEHGHHHVHRHQKG